MENDVNVVTEPENTVQDAPKETLVQKILNVIKGEQKPETVLAVEAAETKSEGSQKEEPTGKMYSDEDITKLIAAEKDKWVAEQQEQERLQKLSPEERAAEEERQKDQKIADLEKKLLLNKEVIDRLSADGLPVDLANVLQYSNKEEMEKSYTALSETWKKSLEDALREALKGKTPDGLGAASRLENSLSGQVANAIKGGF